MSEPTDHRSTVVIIEHGRAATRVLHDDRLREMQSYDERRRRQLRAVSEAYAEGASLDEVRRRFIEATR